MGSRFFFFWIYDRLFDVYLYLWMGWEKMVRGYVVWLMRYKKKGFLYFRIKIKFLILVEKVVF